MCILTEGYYGVNEIFVTEIHQNNLHYIWASANVEKNGKTAYRNYMLSMDDIAALGTSMFIYLQDYHVLFLLLCFFGLLENIAAQIKESLKMSKNVKEQNFLRAVVQILNPLSVEINKHTISYTTQDNCSKQSEQKSHTSNYKILEQKDIGSYLRKLPTGYTASEDAIKNAKQHYIVLPEGYTFVSSFKRKQWINDLPILSPLYASSRMK